MNDDIDITSVATAVDASMDRPPWYLVLHSCTRQNLMESWRQTSGARFSKEGTHYLYYRKTNSDVRLRVNFETGLGKLYFVVSSKREGALTREQQRVKKARKMFREAETSGSLAQQIVQVARLPASGV